MHRKLEDGERWALLDYDDVLVDYIGGLRDFASRTLKRKIVGAPDSWDLTGWLSVTAAEARGLINQFNETDIGFENLKPLSGAVEALRVLRGFGFRTAVITSSSVRPSSVERRARNATAVFGDLIERLHIVPLGHSKREVLATYTNAIWVEDNVANAAAGASLGHRAFLMPMGHNKSVHGVTPPDPGVVHIGGWEEVVPEIVRLLPDPRAALGVREASLRALERASEQAGYGPWTPRNPDSEAMTRLVDLGVVTLTRHAGRRPTAEMTPVGFAALGLDPARQKEPDGPEFEI